MRFTYTGPAEAVEIPALGLRVAKGEEFEATGDDAQSLLLQTDNFTRTDAPVPAKKEN